MLKFLKSLYTKNQRNIEILEVNKMSKSKNPAPFDIGDRIEFINDLPIYGFQKGSIYTVYSLSLCKNGKEWFVRTVERPSSTLCSDFKLCKKDVLDESRIEYVDTERSLAAMEYTPLLDN